MSKERKGHKVCFDKAESIKTMVEYTVSALDRVPKNVASILREDAKVDAKFHKDEDKKFKLGHGPAVRKR